MLFLDLIPWEGEFQGGSNVGRLISNAIDHFQGTFNWLKTPTLPDRSLFRLGPGESRQVLIPVGYYRSLPAGVHHGYVQVGGDVEGSQVRLPCALKVK